MNFRLIVIVSAVTVFMAGVIWKLDSFISSDRLSLAESQLRTQVSSLGQTYASELAGYQRLVFSLPSLQQDKIPWGSLGPFFALGVLENESQAGLQFKQWLSSAKGSPLGADDVIISLKFLFAKGILPTGQTQAWSWQGPDRRTFLSLLFPSSQAGRWIVLVGTSGFLQSPLDTRREQSSTMILLTRSGRILGHSEAEYVGLDMKTHPILQEIQQSENLSGVGTFVLEGESKVLATYEAVANSNLYLVSYTSFKNILAGKSVMVWQLGFWALGFLALILGLQFYLRQESPSVVSGNLAPVEERPETDHRNRLEQIEVYKKIAASLGQDLRATGSSMLGFAQLISQKVTDSEVKKSADGLLREVRNLRVMVDKLLSFSGEKSIDKKDQSLNGLLTFVLKKREPILKEKNVKVKLSLADTEFYPFSATQITQAIENILDNSLEAMQRLPSKEIAISLFEKNGIIELIIQDNGEGIEKSHLGQIFDPFFTTRSYANHVGLGLAAAKAIVKEHHGEIFVESQRGKGTTVRLQFIRERQLEGEKKEIVQVVSENKDDNLAEITTIKMSPKQQVSGPVDVDIDELLAMPEEEEVQTAPLKEDSQILFSESDLSTGPDIEEGVQTSETAATQLQSHKLEIKPVQLQDNIQKNNEVSRTTVVDAPAKASVKPSSPLDSYHVAIPRPEKRI